MAREKKDLIIAKDDITLYNIFMNTIAINIKTEPEVKLRAQRIAKGLGFSLSSLVNEWLKQFVKTKRVTFRADEEPSEYLIKTIKQAEKDRKNGKASPIFNTGKEAIEWLEKQGI